ncbi:MAG: hypothetical protein WC162_11355 [Sphaerochaetaceae bacterium]
MKKNIFILILVLTIISPLFSNSTFQGILNINPTFFYNSIPLNTTSDDVVENPDYSETVQEKFYRYFKVPSITDIGMVVNSEKTRLVILLDIQQDVMTYFNDYQYSNIPFIGNDSRAVSSLNGPDTGFLETTYDRLFISFGRRALKWGPSDYDLALSDNAPYLDNIWLDYSYPLKKGTLKFNYITVGFNNTASNGNDSDNDLYRKTLFAHRFIWETDSLRIGLGELNLIYNHVPSLLDATPLTFFHNNYQQDRSNVLMQISLEKLFKFEDWKFRVYGSFAQDELKLPTENDWPTAVGFNAGIQIHILNGEVFKSPILKKTDFTLREENFKFYDGLNISYEFYYLTPFIYNREIEEGRFTVPVFLFYQGGYLTNENAVFIGFPYGPDSQVHKIELSYDKKNYRFYYKEELIRKGSYTIETEYSEASNSQFYNFKLNSPVKNRLESTLGLNYVFKKQTLINFSIELINDFYNKSSYLSVMVGASINLF